MEVSITSSSSLSKIARPFIWTFSTAYNHHIPITSLVAGFASSYLLQSSAANSALIGIATYISFKVHQLYQAYEEINSGCYEDPLRAEKKGEKEREDLDCFINDLKNALAQLEYEQEQSESLAKERESSKAFEESERAFSFNSSVPFHPAIGSGLITINMQTNLTPDQLKNIFSVVNNALNKHRIHPLYSIKAFNTCNAQIAKEATPTGNTFLTLKSSTKLSSAALSKISDIIQESFDNAKIKSDLIIFY